MNCDAKVHDANEQQLKEKLNGKDPKSKACEMNCDVKVHDANEQQLKERLSGKAPKSKD